MHNFKIQFAILSAVTVGALVMLYVQLQTIQDLRNTIELLKIKATQAATPPKTHAATNAASDREEPLKTSNEIVCLKNLRQIDSAKRRWALDNKKQSGDTPTRGDLKPYLAESNGEWPTCPEGGEYTIGAVGEETTCSMDKHVLP